MDERGNVIVEKEAKRPNGMVAASTLPLEPPASSQALDYLRNRKVCVTGRLFSMTHSELAELVESLGGTFLRNPTRSSFLLLIGDYGWPAESDGSPSHILSRAQNLKAFGFNIEFVSEEEFLEHLGLVEPAGAIRGSHTINDLSRMLQISPARIRRWLRLGLIEPSCSTHRLAYFDFHQVAFAKRLCELLDSGASLGAIRDGIERLRSWLPDGQVTLEQVAGLRGDGRVLMRLKNRLMDGHGQQYFDFGAGTTDPSVPLPTFTKLDEVNELFDTAIAFEDSGNWIEATNAYEQAIKLEASDPMLHFNLGNVLYLRREMSQAIDCFQTAVTLDPQYVEAWNNLGNALAEVGRIDESIDVLRRAVQLLPSYADAHFNLANLLQRTGQFAEAARHRETFERLCPRHSWKSTPLPALQVYRGDEV